MTNAYPIEMFQTVCESAIEYHELDRAEQSRDLTLTESVRLGVAAVKLIIYIPALAAHVIESIGQPGPID